MQETYALASIIGLLLFWAFFALLAALIFGTDRTCGFWFTFLISMVFSPVIGIIAALHYPLKIQMQHLQKQTELLQQIAAATATKQPEDRATNG